MEDGIIVNNIRKLRFNQNEMTQQELADLVGVTRQTINAIEAAKYSPSLDLAFKIATAFKNQLVRFLNTKLSLKSFCF